MQSALAFGLAKNVNNARQPGARRAASAYNLTGRHMSPSSSSPSLSSLTSGDLAAPGLDVQDHHGTPSLLALSAVSVSPLSTSSSCTSISSMVNGDLKGLGYGDHMGTPTPGSLNAQSRDQDGEHLQYVRRGSGVDKTNPFIGCFQTANRGSAAAPPMSAPPAVGSTSSTSTLRESLMGSYQYSSSALISQQKKMMDWIGSQNTRLPSFFARRDEKPPLASSKKAVKRVVSVEEVEPTETPPVALFADYAVVPAVASTVEQEELETVNPAGKGIEQLVKDEEPTDALLSRLRSKSSSSAALSTTSASRFEQDFEILGTLGEGGQGTVFKVRSRVDGCTYAIKRVVLPRSLQRDSVAFHQALREVKAMAAMGTHTNVVRYHTAWLEEDIMEAVDEELKKNFASKPGVSSVDGEVDEDSSVASSFFSHDSYSMSSLSHFDNSMDGFQFESSRSIVGEVEDELLKSRRPLEGVQEDGSEDGSVSSSSASSQPDTQLVLYIQMELCGSAVVTSNELECSDDQEEGDSFQRLINRVTMKATKKPAKKESGDQVVHSTLTSWLRASVDARASPGVNLTKHREGLKLFLGVVRGVQHMHESGVIHRDLKPDNIFIHGDVPKIGDFGLSKSITPDGHELPSQKDMNSIAWTGDGHTTALGTFTYASPEQLGYTWNRAKGTPHQVAKSAKYSTKSDIFALGIILLELCYPCSTMMERSQVLTAVRHGVVPQIALQCFPDEMALVLRMTSLDPDERPTTEEIADELCKLLTTKEALNARAALDELRELQQKLAVAVLQLRDRSQAAQQLELLVAELSDKVHDVGLAIA